MECMQTSTEKKNDFIIHLEIIMTLKNTKHSLSCLVNYTQMFSSRYKLTKKCLINFNNYVFKLQN